MDSAYLRLAEVPGQSAETTTSPWDDPTWTYMRQLKGLPGPTKLAWAFLFFRVCGGTLPAEPITVKASDVAADQNIDPKNGRVAIMNLAAGGLIKIIDRDRRSGVFLINLLDPVVVARARLAPRRDEQAELQLGSCSPAAGDVSSSVSERRPATANAVAAAPPLQQQTATSSVRRTKAPTEPTSLNTSITSFKKEPSNTSNSGALESTVAREVERVEPLAAEAPSADPQRIGASLDGFADRLMETADRRLAKIEELIALQRRYVGDHVRSDRPLLKIAEAVADIKFPQERLLEVLLSWQKQVRAGKNKHSEPGWFYLRIVERSARLIGQQLNLCHTGKAR